MKNYIGNNNEINKKKYKKSRPPKLNPDAGNVEYNIDVFNKMNDIDVGMNSAAGMNGCSENIDKKGDYSVKTLKEALNRLDHYCLDNDKKFYDLRSMYEAVQPNLTADQKNKVKELANKGNVEAIKNYLTLQDPDVQRVLKTKKNLKTSAYVQEEINESADNLTYDELIDLAHKYYKQGGMEIIEFWDENSLREYEKEFGPMTKKQAIRLMKVMGNVSDDEEEAGRYFSKQTYSDETDVDFDESLKESSYSIHSQQDLDDARADLSKKFNDFRALRLPKSDYRYKQLLKDEKDLEKKANEFTASQKGQEIVTKAKLSKLITKLTGLVPIKTTTTSVRGYRPIVGGSFELERYTYDKDITVTFYNNYQIIPELMSKLNDLGYNVRYYSDNAKNTLQVSIFKDNFITADWSDETDVDFDESLIEDTVKQGNKWVNKGDSGKTHGKFKTKKAADAQRRAMFSNGYRAESLDEATQKKNQYFTVMFFHIDGDDFSTHTGIMYGKDEKDIRSRFEQYCPSCKIDRIKKGILGFDYPMITSSFEYDMGWKDEEEYDYDEDEDLVSLDESNDQDLLDLQVALYRALRSIGGDVDNYESVIKSHGYEERIIISFDTECDESVSGIKYKKLAEKKIKEVLNSSKFNQDIDIDMYQKFRSYDDVDYPMEVRSRWFNVGITAVSFNNLMEETKKPKSKILYVIKDKHGNQLSAPTEDDDELWDRVTQMENRGRKGLKVVVYKTEKITESDNSYRGFIIKHRPSDGKTGVVVHVYKDGKLIFTADDDEEAKSDIDNMLNEDYTEADDVWGDPYTFEEVEDQLKDLTNNFSEKDGIVRCWYEQEKVFGVQILKKHYKIVEVSDGRASDDEDMSWVISYATPKRK